MPVRTDMNGNNSNNSLNMKHESQVSILATMNTFVKAVNEMDDTILVPSRLVDLKTPANGKPLEPPTNTDEQALVPHGLSTLNHSNLDLFAFYQMLNAIKAELVQGPDSDQEEEQEEREKDGQQDEQSKQVAKAFRHHLRGLFGVLKQLTGTAQYLTTRYQEDIDLGSANPAGLSSFTL